MKLIRRTGYFFKRAVDNVLENPFLNAVTIAIIAVTLLLSSSFVLVLNDLHDLFEMWGRGVRVIAYLHENVPPTSRDALIMTIKDRPETESVQFIAKNQALARFKKIVGDNREILSDLAEHNPLPESIEIDLRQSHRSDESFAQLSQWLTKQNGVAEVVYGQEWVERFQTTLNLFKIVGFLLGSLLILAAIFIIANTIKITLYARKDELQIMQLVGATNFFIKVPFVIEGSFQGLLGAAIAVAALYGINSMVMHKLVTAFSVPAFGFLPLPVIGWILLGGVVLGAGGSFISVGRFLKS